MNPSSFQDKSGRKKQNQKKATGSYLGTNETKVNSVALTNLRTNTLLSKGTYPYGSNNWGHEDN